MEIFWVLLYLFMGLVPFSFLRYYLFYNKLRVKKPIFFIVFFLLFGIEAVGYIYFSSETIRHIFIFVFCLYSCLIIKERFSKHILVFVLVIPSLSTITGISHIMRSYFPSHNRFIVMTLTLMALYSVVLPTGIWFLKKYIRPLLNCENRSADLICMQATAIFILTFIATNKFSITENAQISMLFSRFLGAFCIIFCCVILTRINNFYLDIQREHEKSSARDKLLALADEQYKQICRSIEATRQTRHDWRHHITVLTSYLNAADYAGVQEYLAAFIESQPQELTLCLSKNVGVNSVLSYIAQQCAENNIDFICNVYLEDDTMGIPEPELCVILGNLLENAVWACQNETSGPKMIRLCLKKEGLQTILITVDNTFTGRLYTHDDKLLSQKHDGFGIGTASTRAIAEQYGGYAKFETIDGEFRGSVLLYENINCSSSLKKTNQYNN